MRDIVQGTRIITKCAWFVSKFVVKNTPAALGILWEVKKELNSVLAQGLHDAKIKYKRNQLENKIYQLNPPIEPMNDVNNFVTRINDAIEGRSNV